MTPKTKITPKKILSIYWKHTAPYKGRVLLMYATMAVGQIIEDFVQPLIISYVLTNLAKGNLAVLSGVRTVYILIGVALAEIVSLLLLNRIVVPLIWNTEEKIMRDLSMTAFDHLQKMSMRFFNNRFAGSLVNQANKFVGSFERLADALTWNVFRLVVSVAATTLVLAPKAPIVSIVIIAVGAIYVPLIWKFRQKQLPYTRRWAAAETARTGQLADTLTNILAVKSFSGEQVERGRMKRRVDAVHDESYATMKITLRQELITISLQRSINILVVIFSVLLALQGKVDVGLIYLALTFTIAIMRRLWDLNNTFRALTRVFGDAYDMAEILAIEPGVADTSTEKIKLKDASVEFEHVTFAHEEEKNPLFKGLDIYIKPGERIGLVGASGGGKTTITQLLLRFMDISSGSIKIGGHDIATMPQSELRKFISYVPQEPLLFHRSLAENIAYGKPNASHEEIVAVSKLAHADEFIRDLSEKYETLVGERGVKLSGGQKQRVAIARAMIKDAPILVLDEATSALDSESERLIQDALQKLMEGRTAIVIAHRLSTIQKLDRIIVLAEGKVIEQGTHESLLKQKGTYAKLWAHQSGGFLDE